MEHMVKIEGVCKKHGSKQILEDISFTARSGRITAFLGPNGAGKSSALRILLGLDWATAGTATFDGQIYQSMTYPLRTVGAALREQAFLMKTKKIRSELLLFVAI